MPTARITSEGDDIRRAVLESGYSQLEADGWAERLETRRTWEFDRLPERFGICLVSNVQLVFRRDGISDRYREFLVEARIDYRP